MTNLSGMPSDVIGIGKTRSLEAGKRPLLQRPCCRAQAVGRETGAARAGAGGERLPTERRMREGATAGRVRQGQGDAGLTSVSARNEKSAWAAGGSGASAWARTSSWATGDAPPRGGNVRRRRVGRGSDEEWDGDG